MVSKYMSHKKSIELIQEMQSPKTLIINGSEVSSFLSKTLEERGCEVEKYDSYFPSRSKFKYIFVFDNPNLADEIYENNLYPDGKFISIETIEEISFPFRNKIKTLKVGDLSLWNQEELCDKILRTLFSSSQSKIVAKHKPAVTTHKKTETVKETLLPATHAIPKYKPLEFIPESKPMMQEEIKNNTIALPDVVRTEVVVEKTQHFSIKKLLFLSAFVTLFILVGLTGLGYWYYLNVQEIVTDLKYQMKSSNMTMVSYDVLKLRQKLKTIHKVYDITGNIIFPIKNNSSYQDIGTLLETSDKTLESSEDFISSIISILPQKTGFSAISDNFSRDKFQTLEKNLENFAAVLIESQKKLDKINISYLPMEDAKLTLSPVISQLLAAYEVLPVAEKIFFQEAPKVYLVLFQNNMELRPTGGFIGSYGLLTVTGGKIIDFKVEDVYTADGQLKGHIDPPNPIRKYLSQPHFYLRDSNFNPDFAVSAVQAAWFLQKELGKEVDGVIGINLTLAQKLLQVIGPIKLTDFKNEEITPSNFFYKAHTISQANFFPGSTQKKDILTAINNEIMVKLAISSESKFPDLISVLKQSLEEKNILLYFKDENLQKIIEDHSWAGRMVNVACVRKNVTETQKTNVDASACFPDYIAVNEANLGVNKANYFINKSTIVEKNILADGQINTTVTIFYENQDSTPLSAGQTYVNYLRIFAPLASKLTNVTLNNASFNPADIDTDTYGSDKIAFGFLVKIAPGNKGVVKISYSFPRALTSDISNYQLFYQKQSGDKNSPLVISITNVPEIKLKPVNFASTAQRDGEIYYTTDTSVDRVFALNKE